jgi:predicted murein hydrolase (TIGR00659 family)
MSELIKTPLFGMMISLIAFEFGCIVSKKTKFILFHPLLIAISMVILFLMFFNISLEDYNIGARYISFLLGPSTVILAVPLYKKINLLKANAVPILGGITIGTGIGITFIILLSKLFSLDNILIASLSPKSVTTPIGIEVSKQLGGIPALSVAAIVISGILGAVIGPLVCKIFKIKNEVAVGTAIGTASHAVGTSKALELGETEGAMSGLSIGLAGLITVFLAPILFKIFC